MSLIFSDRLDKLDLGENFITGIPPAIFNGTLTVNDLNLDYNYIEVLPAAAFRSVGPRRLYLGMNRISTVDSNAFEVTTTFSNRKRQKGK